MDPFRVAVELEEFGFGFWKLFWAKTAFGFKWPQKGHKWICEFIRPIIVENCTIFLKQLLTIWTSMRSTMFGREMPLKLRFVHL